MAKRLGRIDLLKQIALKATKWKILISRNILFLFCLPYDRFFFLNVSYPFFTFYLIQCKLHLNYYFANCIRKLAAC